MTSGSAVFLVDTNVLVYVHDTRDPAKQSRARQVVNTLGPRQTGAVSVQILGEFYTVVTRQRTFLLSASDAEAVVTNYIGSWWVFDISPLGVMEAMRGAQRYGFPYWDAVIWATAKLHMVPYILSEDGNDGAVIEGVQFLNPFAPHFDPTLLATV